MGLPLYTGPTAEPAPEAQAKIADKNHARARSRIRRSPSEAGRRLLRAMVAPTEGRLIPSNSSLMDANMARYDRSVLQQHVDARQAAEDAHTAASHYFADNILSSARAPGGDATTRGSGARPSDSHSQHQRHHRLTAFRRWLDRGRAAGLANSSYVDGNRNAANNGNDENGELMVLEPRVNEEAMQYSDMMRPNPNPVGRTAALAGLARLRATRNAAFRRSASRRAGAAAPAAAPAADSGSFGRIRSPPPPPPQRQRVDGLGDRDRSVSPDGDNDDAGWDTLLATITPDPQPPSAGSSFVAPAPAETSQPAANASAAAARTASRNDSGFGSGSASTPSSQELDREIMDAVFNRELLAGDDYDEDMDEDEEEEEREEEDDDGQDEFEQDYIDELAMELESTGDESYDDDEVDGTGPNPAQQAQGRPDAPGQESASMMRRRRTLVRLRQRERLILERTVQLREQEAMFRRRHAAAARDRLTQYVAATALADESAGEGEATATGGDESATEGPPSRGNRLARYQQWYQQGQGAAASGAMRLPSLRQVMSGLFPHGSNINYHANDDEWDAEAEAEERALSIARIRRDRRNMDHAHHHHHHHHHRHHHARSAVPLPTRPTYAAVVSGSSGRTRRTGRDNVNIPSGSTRVQQMVAEQRERDEREQRERIQQQLQQLQHPDMTLPAGLQRMLRDRGWTDAELADTGDAMAQRAISLSRLVDRPGAPPPAAPFPLSHGAWVVDHRAGAAAESTDRLRRHRGLRDGGLPPASSDPLRPDANTVLPPLPRLAGPHEVAPPPQHPPTYAVPGAPRSNDNNQNFPPPSAPAAARRRVLGPWDSYAVATAAVAGFSFQNVDQDEDASPLSSVGGARASSTAAVVDGEGGATGERDRLRGRAPGSSAAASAVPSVVNDYGTSVVAGAGSGSNSNATDVNNTAVGSAVAPAAANNDSGANSAQVSQFMGGMRRIVETLVRREEVPEEWWVGVGLTPADATAMVNSTLAGDEGEGEGQGADGERR